MRFRILHIIFSSVILFGIIVSCKKDPIQYTFQGTIIESVNQAALSGVDVEIFQKTYEGNVASVFFNPAGSDITNEIGTYEIMFDREKVVEFKIEIFKSGYFEISEIISSGDVTTEDPNINNFALEPKSWVTFNLKNLGGLTTDEFTMIHYNFREDCAGCTTNDYYYYNGIVDSTFTYTTTGGEYARYSYKTPGGASYIQDSIYTTLFDTAVVDLNY